MTPEGIAIFGSGIRRVTIAPWSHLIAQKPRAVLSLVERSSFHRLHLAKFEPKQENNKEVQVAIKKPINFLVSWSRDEKTGVRPLRK